MLSPSREEENNTGQQAADEEMLKIAGKGDEKPERKFSQQQQRHDCNHHQRMRHKTQEFTQNFWACLPYQQQQQQVLRGT